MKKIIQLMKYFFYISISLFVFNFSLAQDVNIEENINLSFACELEKKYLRIQNIIIKLF
jgi:hypothetical protein